MENVTLKQPKIGNKVLIKIRSAGNGRFEKAPPILSRVIAVYSGNKVKVSSGDVWFVKPARGQADFEARR